MQTNEFPRPQAGKSFAEAIKSDPATKAAWSRSQAKLRECGSALKSISAFAAQINNPVELVSHNLALALTESQAQYEAEMKALLETHAVEYAAFKLEWQSKYGAPYPESIEDYKRLATRAGISGERIAAGEWTFADVFPILEGYLQRLADRKADRRQPAQAAQPLSESLPTASANDTPETTVNDVPRFFGLSKTATVVWLALCKASQALTYDDLETDQHLTRKTISAAFKELDRHKLRDAIHGGGSLPAQCYRCQLRGTAKELK
jgi:hypothetical protein